MTDMYSPRQMPKRFLEGAPDVVRENVLDVFAITPAAPLDYDVVLRAPITDCETGEVYGYKGVDFGAGGVRGCHFYLNRSKLREYRDCNRRKRVAWRDLTPAAQSAILAYLAE